jgi:hypothetical protein
VTKYFCDFCGAEITDRNRADGGQIHCSSRLGTTMSTRTGHFLRVEVITSMDGVSNGGLACRFCIIDALISLDTRPERVARS